MMFKSKEEKIKQEKQKRKFTRLLGLTVIGLAATALIRNKLKK